ncbi:beta-galactosidase [Muriicola sp. Z0-33]|uniref:beta-galactosidase n=1 Tax=Muriicola sp. Z0-33 TaxID=2816957 RepID=UPI00223791BC|nr:beta-galactosidase [Muriicola sp. Z0-33]MCW5515693.1 beta-galactosidase [Muriicola sp. Z0-33]
MKIILNKSERITSMLLVLSAVLLSFGLQAQKQGESMAQKTISTLSFENFIAAGCQINTLGKNEISIEISTGLPCTLILQHPELKTLPETAWISFISEVDGLESPSANLLFWSEDNQGQSPDLISASGLFPGLRARNSFPLSVLAEGRGAPKTPGTLIQFSFGKSVDINKWSRLGISFMKFSGEPATVTLKDFKFTAEQPDYPVPAIKIIDEMGQWIQKDWNDKMKSSDEMVSYLRELANQSEPKRNSEKYSEYGGTKLKRFDASGFFRTEHDGKRWWLVDPSGYAFYSMGIDIIGPGIPGNVEGISDLHEWMPEKEGEYVDAWEKQKVFDIQNPTGKELDLLNFHIANLIRSFGNNWHDEWSKITKQRLVEWNVNSIGNWSDSTFISKSKIPYVIPLQNFPITKKRIFRDFPDVFSQEYADLSNDFAKQLEPLKNDKYLIGYFMNNEPGWAYVPTINLAEELLTKEGDYASKDVLVEFLKKRYANINDLNKAWKTSFDAFDQLKQPQNKVSNLSEIAFADLEEFSTIMLEKYIEVPVKAAKTVDPNHLNMGMRWASGALKESWRFAGTQYLDVFSMNNYTDNPSSRLDIAAEFTNKPILIGEFHHGSMEAGHSAFGARWTRTEADRAVAYRYYAENAAAHPNSIGIHYFSFNDDPVLGRFDGQNFHQGFVSVGHKPYSDFVKGYSKVNDELYEVVMGLRAAMNELPEGLVTEIPMKF